MGLTGYAVDFERGDWEPAQTDGAYQRDWRVTLALEPNDQAAALLNALECLKGALDLSGVMAPPGRLIYKGYCWHPPGAGGLPRLGLSFLNIHFGERRRKVKDLGAYLKADLAPVWELVLSLPRIETRN
jgi:hypothetical protein